MTEKRFRELEEFFRTAGYIGDNTARECIKEIRRLRNGIKRAEKEYQYDYAESNSNKRQ